MMWKSTRRVICVLAGVGLMATVGLWYASCDVDHPALFHRDTALTLSIEDGWVCLSRQPENRYITTGRPVEYIEQGSVVPFNERPELLARAPMMAPLVLFAGILVGLWIISWLRRRWYRGPGFFCTACGYNLTGNVSGVCPECGTTVGKVETRVGRVRFAGRSGAHREPRGPRGGTYGT